jgi:hypothetical protein
LQEEIERLRAELKEASATMASCTLRDSVCQQVTRLKAGLSAANKVVEAAKDEVARHCWALRGSGDEVCRCALCKSMADVQRISEAQARVVEAAKECFRKLTPDEACLTTGVPWNPGALELLRRAVEAVEREMRSE